MIIKFDPDIFDSSFSDLHGAIYKIILEFIEERFLWDFENLSEIFPLDDDGKVVVNPFINNLLLPKNVNDFKERINVIYGYSNYISSNHKKYLSTISIGLRKSEISPSDAYNIIIKEPSIVIVENFNDWNFIEGIAKKYSNNNKRKEIYRLILKNIDNNWVRPEHAGGKSQIENSFNWQKSHYYNNVFKYKIMTLFDSDRLDSTYIATSVEPIIKYFKKGKQITLQNAIYEEEDLILWHMLYKRELENYVPLSLIESITSVTSQEMQELYSKDPKELDYIKYEDFFRPNSSINVKNEFPLIFMKNFTRDILENRCSHHVVDIETPNNIIEQVSELEQILLKIAKII